MFSGPTTASAALNTLSNQERAGLAVNGHEVLSLFVDYRVLWC